MYEEKFVSHLEIDFPYSFNDEFFKWFDYKEWDRLKGVFKEMKRRRGDGKALRIELNFSGEPDINFIIQSDQSQWFKMEVEKIDFVVELVTISEPKESRNELDRMISCVESLISKLNLPYRIVKLCSADIGFSSSITFDFEIWMPGQNKFREGEMDTTLANIDKIGSIIGWQPQVDVMDWIKGEMNG